MNRTGDMIVNLYSKDIWRKQNKYGTRTIFPSDSKKFLTLSKRSFQKKKVGY